MQEKVYKKRIKDIDELCSRMLTAWDKMDQCIIDKAVKQWRTRLRSCIKAKVMCFANGTLLTTRHKC